MFYQTKNASQKKRLVLGHGQVEKPYTPVYRPGVVEHFYTSVTMQNLYFFNMTFSLFFPFDSNWLHPPPWLTCLLLPCMSTPLIIKSPGLWGSGQYPVILEMKPLVRWPQRRFPVKLETSGGLSCASAPEWSHWLFPCETRQSDRHRGWHGTRYTDQLPPTPALTIQQRPGS